MPVTREHGLETEEIPYEERDDVDDTESSTWEKYENTDQAQDNISKIRKYLSEEQILAQAGKVYKVRPVGNRNQTHTVRFDKLDCTCQKASTVDLGDGDTPCTHVLAVALGRHQERFDDEG